jgi:uncharacterized protein (TIRG00374 family)
MEELLNLSGPVLYSIVALLAFAECALLVGLLVPGESALILSGVLVSQGRAELGWMILAGWLGGVLGDSISYSVGKRFGPRLVETRLGRRVGSANWERARRYLQDKGGRAVFGGRFIGILRALIPAVAGWARMPYRTFLVHNAAGALVWSAGCIGAGALAGRSWPLVRDWIGGTSLAAGIVVVFVLGLVLTIQRARARQASPHELAGRLLRWSVVTVSVGILVHIVGLALPGIRESAGALMQINPVYVAAAVGLEILALGALTQLYLQTVRTLGGRLSFREAVGTTMSGFTVSRVLPGGGATGGFFMARGMTARGVPAATATSAVFIGGATGMGVLGIVVIAGALATLVQGDLPPGYLVGIPVAVAMVIGAALLAARMLKSATLRTRVFSAAERCLRALRLPVDLATPRRFLEEVARSLPPLRRLTLPMRWSALFWLADATVLWLLFAAFGEPVGFGVVLVAYGAANLLNALPISPGGLGLVEAGLSATFVAFGVPPSVALTAVLVYRLVSFWLPLAGGVPAYLAGTRRRPALTGKPLPEGSAGL